MSENHTIWRPTEHLKRISMGFLVIDSKLEYFLQNKETFRGLCVRVSLDFALSFGSGSLQDARFGFGKVSKRQNLGSEYLY